MKNQKGFTLVELMVVLAIIGVLSSFGISRYLGAIANARDTIRIGDIRNIETMLLWLTQGGVAPNVTDLQNAIKANNGWELIINPSWLDAAKCIDWVGDGGQTCGYKYATCDEGFLLQTNFESGSNITKYKNDEVSGSPTDGTNYDNGNVDTYEIGNCTGTVNAFDSIEEV